MGAKNIDIKVILFKESGKYYTEETVSIPCGSPETAQVMDVADWLERNYKSYRGMHLVAMLNELKNGYPIMIPAEKRA